MDTLAIETVGAVQQRQAPSTFFHKHIWRADTLTAGLLYVLAVFFHFYRLGGPSLWYDETWSVDIARQPFGVFWHIITTHDPNMGLYYVLLRLWVQLFGWIGVPVTEFWARFPSVVFSSFAGIVLFLLAKRFIGRLSGAIATFLFIVNVEILAYVQQVRSYGLLIFLLIISWYALVVLLSSPSVKKRWWVLYVLSTALAIYAQLFTVFIIAAQVTTLVGIACISSSWRRNFWRRWQWFLLSQVGIALLIIPEAWVALHNIGKVDWLPRPTLADLYGMFRILTGQNKTYFLLAIAVLGAGALVILVSAALAWKPALWQTFPSNPKIREPLQQTFTRADFLPLFWALLCWLIVPLFLSYVLSLGSSRYFSARYLMVITPAFCLLIGLTLASLPNRGVQALLSLQLVLLATLVGYGYYAHAQIEDWRTPTQWIQAHYHAGDGIVCYDNIQGCQFASEYYFDTYPQSGAHYTPDTPGLWPIAQDSLAGQDAEQATNPQALAVFAAHHPHIFYIVGRLSNDQTAANAARGQAFLDSHYQFVGQCSSQGVTVRMYTTGS